MFLIELKEVSARRNIYRKRMENKIEKAPAERYDYYNSISNTLLAELKKPHRGEIFIEKRMKTK